MILILVDQDTESTIAVHGNASLLNSGLGHVTYAFCEVLETSHIDFTAEIGGRPKLVKAACPPCEVEVRRGVRVQYVMYFPILRRDDYLDIAYLIFVPGV